MSSVQVTPRKRKSAAAEGLLTPQSTRKTRTKAAPAPNPPLAPFPTPPSSRTRRIADDISFEYTAELLEQPSTKFIENRPLPTHLQTLLTIHHAFNLALSLHIATKPPILPPHPPSTVQLQLPCLTNYLAIRETVERTGGRRFGTQELARLAWIWQWDGQELPQEEHGDEDENPFLVRRDRPSANPEVVCAMSYVITPTRTLDASGKRVQTYGLGIELDLRPGETRQLLHNGAEGGLGNKGQGGGMGAVGRWNTSGEMRHDMVREKLEKWIDLNGGYEPPVVHSHGLPTPTTSNSSRSTIPPIPMLPLPKLPSAPGLLPSANLFSSSPSSAAGLPGLATPPKKTMSAVGLSDPFTMDEPSTSSKPCKAGSIEERRKAMQDRIKKRSEASKGPVPTLGSAINSGYKINMSAAAQQEELKRRSTLSRLESVAEGVWMLFSASSSSSSNVLSTPPRTRRKTIPLAEVAGVIVKSSKTPISFAEAETSLSMLTDLCPFFLQSKVVGRQEWLEMPANVAYPPSPSPGSQTTSGADVSVPAFSTGPPTSPSPRARSRLGGELAGPASPGRVRRVGGLREVRERIRKELGDW